MNSHTQQQSKLFELFRTLDQADINSKKVKEHSVVLLGLSRAGKSATMNWICEPSSMVGRRLGTNIFYVPANSQTPKNPEQALRTAKIGKMAEIGHTFASVTIMANMKSLAIDKVETTFLDFGGFGERREPVEIIKVNYVLAAYLLQISKIKFILVVTENAFNDISSNGLRDTLQQFLKLFDFEVMTQQQKEHFLNSVSLLITSASRKYTEQIILEQLKIIIYNFQDLLDQKGQNSYIQKFPMCKRLLEKLIKSKRFQLFPLAEEGKPPKETDIIASFSKKNWQYFNIKNCKQSLCYPYVEQFHKLKRESQNKIIEIIIHQNNITLA